MGITVSAESFRNIPFTAREDLNRAPELRLVVVLFKGPATTGCLYDHISENLGGASKNRTYDLSIISAAL